MAGDWRVKVSVWAPNGDVYASAYDAKSAGEAMVQLARVRRAVRAWLVTGGGQHKRKNDKYPHAV